MEIRLLLLDGEYGGIRSKGDLCTDYSILELALKVVTKDFKTLDEIEFKIKPENDQYIVSAEGLMVNKINLIEHDKNAISEGKAKELLYQFLKKNSDNGKIRLIPVGKGVTGDIKYLTSHKFISEYNWHQFCSYEVIELGTLALCLKIKNKLKQTVKPGTNTMSNSMEALGHYLNVPMNNLHSAKGDVMLSEELLKVFFMKLDHIPDDK
jgi:hypothetical protein